MTRIALLIAALLTSAAHAAPEPAIVLPVTFVRAIDGDTLDCDVTVRVRVRLKDCWCAETGTPAGDAATKALALDLAGFGGAQATGTMAIPLASMELHKLFSFGRVVAHCYVDGQAKSLSQRQIERGRASSRKGGEVGQ